MVFSKIGNELFYRPKGDKRDSMLKEIGDNKVILILHNLYIMTDREGNTNTNINHLIEKCGYKVARGTQSDFKNILYQLEIMGLIKLNKEIKSYTELLIINTSGLNTDKNFFIIEDKELKIMRDGVDNPKEFLNLIKIYYYLKARIYKSNEIIHNSNGGRSQTTFNTYEDISKHTLIGEGNIKRYIDMLKDKKLIKYANLGYKYKNSDVENKSECANLYALPIISEELIDLDMREGLKQQRYYYEENGYTIIDVEVRSNKGKQIAGIYGSLLKKAKNGSLTIEEIEELSQIELMYDAIKRQKEEAR